MKVVLDYPGNITTKKLRVKEVVLVFQNLILFPDLPYCPDKLVITHFPCVSLQPLSPNYEI